MREVYFSNCEKSFIHKVVEEGYRIDGRNYNESRQLDISFGSDYGSCMVSLGETKVLAQVSCEVVQPKQIRPNEGVLYVNVELGPMAAPQFEPNRQTDLSVYLNRLLEKCFKDSKCIDLESLCIVVEEKVWSLRVDVKILNHDGNLIECASIATLTSLAHFKRPDVTRSGDTVIIHTLVERDPIPTVLYHYPVCVTFSIFGNDILVSDPSLVEESVVTSLGDAGATGVLLVVGMNQYREVCVLNLAGAAVGHGGVVGRAVAAAAERCKMLVDHVKRRIAEDDALRQKRAKINLSQIITEDQLMSLSRKELNIRLKHFSRDETHDQDAKMESNSELSEEEDSKYDVKPTAPLTAEVVAKKGSKWIEISSDSDEE